MLQPEGTLVDEGDFMVLTVTVINHYIWIFGWVRLDQNPLQAIVL
jgi:hypothetical protein